MGEEKRNAVRVKRNLNIQYQYALNDQTLWDMSVVKDISETGIHINTSNIFPVNAAITLSLKLPTNPLQAITIKGRVIDSKRVGQSSACSTRIKFVELNDEQKVTIHQFVEWAISKEGKK
jgi:hypothetical protein